MNVIMVFYVFLGIEVNRLFHFYHLYFIPHHLSPASYCLTHKRISCNSITMYLETGIGILSKCCFNGTLCQYFIISISNFL